MIQGMGAALAGLRAYINNTRTTANNLANIGTEGFKASRTLQSPLPGGLGVATTGTQTLQGQGSIAFTGNPFDLAIGGEGFFRVTTPSGAAAYTRAGSFHVDNQGRLADPAGNRLTPDITIPGGASNVAVGQDGAVTAMVNGTRQTIGQVELVKFMNPSGLQQGGANLYFETPASGQPVTGAPGTDGLGALYPASLELSNVDIAAQMVSLIENRHAISAQVKTIQTADEMLGAIMDIKA